MAQTAWALGHRTLYHWQGLDMGETKAVERFTTFLQSKRLYLSSPSAFNDPWDCRPHFNTEVLADADVLRRHVDWALAVCQRHNPLSSEDSETMRAALMADSVRAAALLDEISGQLCKAIAEQYRVYCLGPDPRNTLMWSHYAKDHTGICLEYSLRNDVMCAALECEYLAEFPMLLPHDQSEADNLRVLLAKSSVWAYEQEFRLVAQENAKAMPAADALLTEGSYLQLPDGALTGVIVGCQGNFDAVKELVASVSPGVAVKRAARVPNRYELDIKEG